MPIYEFQCCHCRQKFERLEKLDAQWTDCECGYIANRTNRPLPTTFKLNGQCWEKDGYRSKKPTALDRVPK